MNQPEKALFNLAHYVFKEFHYVDSDTENPLSINFTTSGVYVKDEHHFLVVITFEAKDEKPEKHETICKARLNAMFRFDEDFSGEIPDYFYPNSIAIAYPYLRAFISSVTVQANGKKMMLPVSNLSNLGKELKENTDYYNNKEELAAAIKELEN